MIRASARQKEENLVYKRTEVVGLSELNNLVFFSLNVIILYKINEIDDKKEKDQ